MLTFITKLMQAVADPTFLISLVALIITAMIGYFVWIKIGRVSDKVTSLEKNHNHLQRQLTHGVILDNKSQVDLNYDPDNQSNVSGSPSPSFLESGNNPSQTPLQLSHPLPQTPTHLQSQMESSHQPIETSTQPIDSTMPPLMTMTVVENDIKSPEVILAQIKKLDEMHKKNHQEIMNLQNFKTGEDSEVIIDFDNISSIASDIENEINVIDAPTLQPEEVIQHKEETEEEETEDELKDIKNKINEDIKRLDNDNIENSPLRRIKVHVTKKNTI